MRHQGGTSGQGTAQLAHLAGRNTFHVLQKDRRVRIQLCRLLWESRKRKENLPGLQWLCGCGSSEVGMGRLQGISVAKGERRMQYGLRRVL